MIPNFFLEPSLWNIIIFILISIITIFSLFLFKGILLNIKNLLIVLVLLINIYLTALFNSDFRNGYLVITMCIIGAYFISTIYRQDEFIENYIKILVFLSVYSIIATYIIVPIATQFMIFPSIINEHGVIYLNMGFATPIVNSGFYRNTGLYIEPGMFQVFLTYALIFELFLVNRKIKFFNTLALSLGSITTFSPVGYIALLLLIIAYFINNKERKTVKNIKKTILSFVLIIFLLFLFIIKVPNVYDAALSGINKLVNKESSYQGRTASIIANIESGFESPIIGKGISYGFESTIENFLGTVTTHNTSTSTVYFMIFGIFFIIIILYLHAMVIFSKKRNLISSILIFVASLIAVNSQLLIYDQVFYLLLFVCFMANSKEHFVANNTSSPNFYESKKRSSIYGGL